MGRYVGMVDIRSLDAFSAAEIDRRPGEHERRRHGVFLADNSVSLYIYCKLYRLDVAAIVRREMLVVTDHLVVRNNEHADDTV